MSTTLHVSLFLPNTIAFHNAEDQRQSSTSATGPNKRSNPSTVDLTTRASQVSLLDSATVSTPPLLTPGLQFSEGFFVNATRDSQKLLFARPGDPRSLLRSDADVPEWGAQAVFNQPRSRAGPLPSGSILRFALAHDELVERRKLSARKDQKQASSSPGGSRNQSHDRGFAGKTWTVEPAIQGNGGLFNAVRASTSDGDRHAAWIGTLGFPTDDLPTSIKEDISDRLMNEYESTVVHVSDKDLDGHYSHYCKTILWPIFNYQVPDHPKSKAYADHSWEFYRNVNQAFANKVVASYKRRDTIWIHDYHLLLVPGMVRRSLPDAQIGFFLHNAFPSSEVFRCLATRRELLEGMLGANLVAFQTDEYAIHFLQTCSRLLTVETTNDGVQLEDHFVNITSEPIGINFRAIEEARQDPELHEWVEIIRNKYKDKKIIVGRDKLDNIRGMRQKLLAYELFLSKHPEFADKVVLIQVATSTSEHTELLTTVSDICTRIDSAYSTLAHQPLVFLKQDIGFSQYLALLTIADVLIISSLRDGMNLTPHEYILCQDGIGSSKKHGPLILSEFTGCHGLFGRSPLSINPWDYKQQAEAIKTALEMDEETKAARWQQLHKVVMEQTGEHWVRQLQKEITRVHDEHARHASTSVPRLSVARVVEAYKTALRRIIIIDYEGTLAPHRTTTGIPLSSLQRVLDTLLDLMADSRNIVYVMSAHRPEELESTFRALPSLGLIAENGSFLRNYSDNTNGWQQFPDPEETVQWKANVRGILKYYTDRLEGSSVEERRCSLLFRYDKAEDQDAAIRQGGECADQINSACRTMRIRAVPVKNAVIIEHEDFTKRTAATQIFNALHQRAESGGQPLPDFMLVAGDNREDEVVFDWANERKRAGVIENVFTVSVGKRNTMAQATLTHGSTGLITVLQKLARISTEAEPLDYFNNHRTNSGSQ